LRASFRKKIDSTLKLAELIFFPSLCELCSRLLEVPGEKIVCHSCLRELHPRRTSYCLCCGRFFDDSGEPHFCRECLEQRTAFSMHRSCGSYEGKLKDIIILYKYKGYKVLGKELALFAVKALGDEESLWWKLDALVPVPLHPKKEAQRGFNQAKVLALELAKLINVPVMERRLVKVKNTPPQTSLEVRDRHRNLRAAFDVILPEKIEGKTLLLVDDVFTTGSTLQQCSLALKKAGPQEIRALTIAQA
jgi:competence protein ComFC